MKRFEFRLERVRKWRQDQAELEEMRLQQIYAQLRGLEEEEREVAASTERFHRGVVAQESVTAQELGALEAYQDYTRHEIRRLQAKQKEVKAHLEKQRQRVLEAHRRVQLLDGLRDKALTAWTTARDKEQEELGAELYLGNLTRKAAAVKSREED